MKKTFLELRKINGGTQARIVPEEEGNAYYEVDLSEEPPHPEVTELYIGERVKKLTVKNATFPNVRKVISRSGAYRFSSCGFLVNHKGVLEHTFFRGPEEILDMEDIFWIGNYAMEGCESKHFLHETWICGAEDHAFDGSALLKTPDYIEGVCSLGAAAVALDADADNVVLKHTIRTISETDRKKTYRKLTLVGDMYGYDQMVKYDIAGMDTETLCFQDCTLEKFLNIPESCLNRFREHAKKFDACGETDMFAEDGILYAKRATKEGRMETCLVCCPKTKAGTVLVPEGVEAIWPGAFAYCGKLTKVHLPDSLGRLDYNFCGCSSLEEVVFGSGIKEIGNNCFTNCGFKQLQFPDNIQEIGANSFTGNQKLESVILHKHMKRIGNWTCSGCQRVKKLCIGSSKLQIGVQDTDWDWDRFSNVTELQLPPKPLPKETIRTLLALTAQKEYAKVQNGTYLTLTIPGQKHPMFLPKSISGKNIGEIALKIQNWYQHPGNPGVYYQYAQHMSHRLDTAYASFCELRDAETGKYLKDHDFVLFRRKVETGEEKDVIGLIRLGLLSERNLKPALSELQEKGMTVATAYLLQQFQRHGSHPLIL